jgi:RNA polymerase sigma-32 factor
MTAAARDTPFNGSLSTYMDEIKALPMLAPGEEFILAKHWRDDNDRQAVVAIGYRHYGLPVEDLVEEANIGLLRAAQLFDPNKGFKFATYARWWIRAGLQEYVLRSWSLVRIGTTSTQKTLFYNLRRAKTAIGVLDDGDMTNEQVATIAKKLKATKADVIDINRRLNGDMSLNAPSGITNYGAQLEHQDLLIDDAPDPETVATDKDERDRRLKALRDALTVLNPRQRHIFEARRLYEEPLTLQQLSDQYGIARERVRQIEVSAFKKVQKAIKAKIAAAEIAEVDLPQVASNANHQPALESMAA